MFSFPTVELENPHSGLSGQMRFSAQCGLPCAQERMKKNQADTWNKDWKYPGRHWGETSIS